MLGVLPLLPWWVYHPLVYMPTYTPWVYQHAHCTHGAGRYMYTGVMMRSERPWGSVLKNSLGRRGREASGSSFLSLMLGDVAQSYSALPA